MVPEDSGDDARDAAVAIRALAERLRATGRHDEAWALLAMIAGALPMEDSVVELVRAARTLPTGAVAAIATESAMRYGIRAGSLDRDVAIWDTKPIVDVDFTATHDHNTGIQRVVRNAVPRWARTASFALTAAGGANADMFRTLTAQESQRVMSFGDPESPLEPPEESVTHLLPWRTSVILTEVPSESRLASLVALARFSGNAVSAIGYDTIPLVSRDTVSRQEMNKFAKYLTLVKYLTAVVAISDAAAEEFSGFRDMVAAQGLTGPRVLTARLPTETPVSAAGTERSVPLVLCVGSKEPRKNQTAVLLAAEQLWREGLVFDLRFVGTYGWDTRDFRRWLARVENLGRPVAAPWSTSDQELDELYSQAAFTVFPSIHEGYGLPIVESLSHGTPVITSRFGSTAEIAADGGCLLVDPRSDEQLVAAMRDLLSSDATLGALRLEARARKPRSWDDYAQQSWAMLSGE